MERPSVLRPVQRLALDPPVCEHGKEPVARLDAHDRAREVDIVDTAVEDRSPGDRRGVGVRRERHVDPHRGPEREHVAGDG